MKLGCSTHWHMRELGLGQARQAQFTPHTSIGESQSGVQAKPGWAGTVSSHEGWEWGRMG